MPLETKKIVSHALDAVLNMNPVTSLVKVLAEKAYEAATSTNKVDAAEIEALTLQTKKSELEMRIAEAQAKVAQELAIAQRIQTATEVEMEEFYEYSGSGKIGANITEAGIAAGIGAEGKRVSKRIFRFKSLKDIDATVSEGTMEIATTAGTPN